MKYLVDSDWLIDVYIGRRRVSQILDELHPQGLAVSIISHGELFEGAFDFLDSDARLARIRTLLSRFETLPLTDSIMESFGRTRSQLRQTGLLIPDLDLLIAATAIDNDLALMTCNLRHFARIPELRIYQQN